MKKKTKRDVKREREEIIARNTVSTEYLIRKGYIDPAELEEE